MTRCFHRDVIVVREIDTGLQFCGIVRGAKELMLSACVGRTWKMLAIFPLAVAGPTSGITTTTTSFSFRSSVPLLVKPTRGGDVPCRNTIWGVPSIVVGLWGEVWSIGPI